MKEKAAKKKGLREGKKLLTGKWRITSMGLWDKGYFDEEVKAFISIQKGGCGEFHFGYVQGDICGEFKSTPLGVVFDFTFEATEESEQVSGDGWICTADGKIAEGEIRFHCGDKSGFLAKKLFEKIKR